MNQTHTDPLSRKRRRVEDIIIDLGDIDNSEESLDSSEIEVDDFQLKFPEGANLDNKQIKQMDQYYQKDPLNKIIENALSNNYIHYLAENRDTLKSIDYVYNHQLPHKPKPSDQMNSGRCWMFAGLNAMRYHLMDKYQLKDNFELSGAYLFYWDRLERANRFLEVMINWRDRPIDDREVNYMLGNPIEDGGYWHYFVELVLKYGVMPKTNYDECFNTNFSNDGLDIINEKLRDYAVTIRNKSFSEAELRKEKKTWMQEIYGIVNKFYGKPPDKFTWKFYDTEEKIQEIKNITPLRFYQVHVNYKVEMMIVLCHDPRHPYYHTCVRKNMGNLVEGKPIAHINLPIKKLKKYASESIKNGEPVWFACDMGQKLYQDKDLMDPDAFDYERLLGTKFTRNKKERVEFGSSSPNHAMLLVGVDEISNGKYRKWRVENSWGGEPDHDPDKSYIQMSDKWFDEYVFEVVIDLKYILESDLTKIKKEIIELESWDNLGMIK